MDSLIPSAGLLSITEKLLPFSTSSSSHKTNQKDDGHIQKDVEGGDNTACQGQKEETEIDVNDRPIAIPGRQTHSPKKRMVLLSAFLACLSFMIILCNSMISFANDLLRDDAFLKMLQNYLLVHNITINDQDITNM